MRIPFFFDITPVPIIISIRRNWIFMHYSDRLVGFVSFAAGLVKLSLDLAVHTGGHQK